MCVCVVLCLCPCDSVVVDLMCNPDEGVTRVVVRTVLCVCVVLEGVKGRKWHNVYTCLAIGGGGNTSGRA